MAAILSAYTPSAGTVIQPSKDATGVRDAAAINAAVAALPANGGMVTLAPTGNWNILCGQVVITRSGVYINAPGTWISAVGSGDVFRMYDTSSIVGRTVNGGGILGYPVIDGSSTTGNSAAVHAGDIFQLAMYCKAQNFTAGTTSKGFWFDNQYFWTEEITGEVFTSGNTANVVFDNSTGTSLSASATGSFARAQLDAFINQKGIGNGVVAQGGAVFQDHDLGIFGNFLTSTTQYAVLLITGSNAIGNSTLNAGGLTIGVECDDTAHTPPYTIQFGATGNGCFKNTGYLDFAAASPFTASNKTSNFSYYGQIFGDTVLVSASNLFLTQISTEGGLALGSFAAPQSITANGQTINGAGGKAYVPVTCSASFTGLILGGGFSDGQLLVVTNVGTGSLTFAAAATSHVADGASDVIAAGTSRLFIFDSGTSLWYRTQ